MDKRVKTERSCRFIGWTRGEVPQRINDVRQSLFLVLMFGDIVRKFLRMPPVRINAHWMFHGCKIL